MTDDRRPDRPEQEHPGRTGGPGRDGPRHTRWLYARVLLVQIATLVALWLLQSTYAS